MAKKYTHQPIPCKRGDIVRVLPQLESEKEFWGHIAVVTAVDKSPKNGGYPYQMHLLDHEYDSEIWLAGYEVVGNVVQAVELLWYYKHPALLASMNKRLAAQMKELRPKKR